jgi:hypothetical protein
LLVAHIIPPGSNIRYCRLGRGAAGEGPLGITLSELAIETFFPADHATIAIVRALPA